VKASSGLPTLAERLGVADAKFRTPEATVRTFATALTVGNLDAATSCLAPEVSLLTPDGTAVSGQSAREVLRQLIDQRPRIEMEPPGTVIAGGVAYVNQRWRIRIEAASEQGYEQVVSPILVLRQVGEQWKLAIAALWIKR
jgi:ketosteroid isomerase-like protein